MIYLIGGAPRVGKSAVCRAAAARLKVGWVSTDLLMEILRVKQVEGVKRRWDASPEEVRANAEWFYPCLERVVWGAGSMAEGYVVEGVDFLPEQAARLAERFEVRSVFLGRSGMTLAHFETYAGNYAGLPEEMRRQIAADVPRWSAFVRVEAEKHGLKYVEMSGDFHAQVEEAVQFLIE